MKAPLVVHFANMVGAHGEKCVPRMFSPFKGCLAEPSPENNFGCISSESHTPGWVSRKVGHISLRQSSCRLCHQSLCPLNVYAQAFS